jgi:DNA-binding MarR family transcriptional regulator
MTKREAFIKIIRKEIFNEETEKTIIEKYPDIFADAKTYFLGLTISEDKENKKFTDNGKLVLKYMKEHKEDFNNLFKAKDIGEGLSISSRTASGALRKLVSDGYAERMGESPVVYSLTKEGIEVDLNAEEG